MLLEEDAEDTLGKIQNISVEAVVVWGHQEAHCPRRAGAEEMCRHERSGDDTGCEVEQARNCVQDMNRRHIARWTSVDAMPGG